LFEGALEQLAPSTVEMLMIPVVDVQTFTCQYHLQLHRHLLALLRPCVQRPALSHVHISPRIKARYTLPCWRVVYTGLYAKRNVVLWRLGQHKAAVPPFALCEVGKPKILKSADTSGSRVELYITGQAAELGECQTASVILR